jgi:hypothetical protein
LKEPAKAIEYYEKGIALNDNRCWAEMAEIFNLEHVNNWEKCWANYFASDDFLQNIEHPNSIDCTSNRLYSFGYICQMGTLVALGRDIKLTRLLTPIINHIQLDRAYA